jgi:Outer membrane protein and related peptidoglycan-associated (lipo)proteins
MSIWTKWIWPGLVTTAFLTALVVWFETGRVEAELAARAQAALGPTAAWARLDLSGRDLAVTGFAPDEAAQAAALAAVHGVAGLRTVRDLTSLLPVQTPYRLTGEKGEGGITLTGFVPSDEARTKLLDTVSAALPGLELKANVDFARGAPDDLIARAGFAAAQFGHLADGGFEIVDGAITLSGTAVSPEDFDALHAALAAAPYEVAADIRPAAPREPAFLLIGRDDKGFTLSGHAPSAAARETLLTAVREAAEQGEIRSGLLVAAAPETEAEAWEAQAHEALAIAAELASGEVRVTAGRIDVSGETDEEAALARLRDRLGGELASGLALGTSDIGMRVVSPYVWSASLAGDRIELSGYLPAEADRAVILDEIRRRIGDVPITDTAKWAGGAPEGFERAVSVALAALGRFEKGSVKLEGQVLIIDGFAFAPDADKKIAELADTLPAGFSARSNVSLLPDPASTPDFHLDSSACQTLLDQLAARNTIRFETGKAQISEDSFGYLDRIGYAVRRCANEKLEIGGHTDAQGEEAANQALSVARAEAVAAYLVQAGVEAERLTMVGYGESRPVADNATEEGRAKNRRIEFRVRR